MSSLWKDIDRSQRLFYEDKGVSIVRLHGSQWVVQ
jgi:hypothetical protein